MRGLWLCFCVLLATHVFAQPTTATLTGTIRDQEGGVVPGAQVTATFG